MALYIADDINKKFENEKNSDERKVPKSSYIRIEEVYTVLSLESNSIYIELG